MFALLLLVLYPVLYNKNRTWYFIYTLLFFVIGRFVAFKAGISYATIIHNISYLGVLLPFVSDKVYKKYFMPIILWVIVYVFYLVFLHIVHGNELFSDIKDNFRVLFVFILAVEVLENIKNNRIDNKYFYNAFKLILIFQIVLCWLQYAFHDFGNLFRVTEYTWNGQVMSMTGDSEDMVDSNLSIGTLMGSSPLANFLTVCIVLIFLAKSKSGLVLKDYFLLALGVITLLITGIRAPFLVLIVLLYFIVMRGKSFFNQLKYLFLGIVGIIILLPILSGIGSQGGLGSFDNTVMRSLNVFTQLESGSVSEEGTLTWPLSMVPYIVEHPLIGNGLHYGKGYFMVLNFHILEDNSITDAGLFFHWAEYGLVGIAVFFFFYYYLIRISTRFGFDKSDMRFLVITLLLLSIVDCSILSHYCTTVFALSPIIIGYYQKKEIYVYGKERKGVIRKDTMRRAQPQHL